MSSLKPELIEYFKKTMNVNRLSKTGLFKRMSMPENSTNVQADILLHRMVLDRALVDLFSPINEIRQEVKDWLNLNNESFLFSCERAGLEPDLVYKCFEIIEEILKDGGPTSFHRTKKTVLPD